jgi:hypothetical protein
MRIRSLAAVVVLLVFAACSGQDGAPGADGHSMLLRTADELAGGNCASGGLAVAVGLDDDRDGLLDDAEIDATVYVCDGAQGRSVVPSLELPGTSCPEGGVRLTPDAGPATFVCNGAPGATGAAGESVTVTAEAGGTNCTYGGQRLQVGSGTPTFVCNGAPGDVGAAGQSVAMTPEDPGTSCTYGGQRLQVGSGTPTFVCNGAPGADGQDGASVTMVPEPAGPNCEFGGVLLQVGAGPGTYLCSGAPSGVRLATVETAEVTDVRYVAAVVRGTIVDDGNEMIMVKGVVLADHAAPTLRDAVYFSGGGSAAFDALCDGLQPATTYYVRAFATNALGTSYGSERSFATRALTIPALTTQAASNVTATTAIGGGVVTDDGGTPILSRGVCWSLAADPTLADACASEGEGAGSFLTILSGLASSTTWHVRAYATNAQGTGFGDDRTFTTAAEPLATVTTAAPSAVSYTTATGGGTVVSDGGAPVSQRGVCWGTAPAPTTAGTCYGEAGAVGTFTASMTGLAPATTYHVRAFAVNAGGTSYGDERTFTTLAPSVPSLTTKAVGGISSWIAGSGGLVATDGGAPITQKGVCWSVNPGPTIANTRTTDGTGPASFNSTMSGLSPLTTYHVRAYATNGLGTAYGNEVVFTTTDLATPGPTVPVVGTSSSAISGATTAASGGYVSNDGGSAVTARGVCWSTAQNPTVADSCSADGTGVGFFSSTVTGLSGCGIVYYVRAYATNATGTQNTVSTGLLPTVATWPVGYVGYFDALSGGTISDDGGCPISQKGVAWSWSPSPTIGNPRTTNGAGNASFSSSLTGLYGNRTYYVRAYASNSVGTAYGAQEVFTTAEPPTPYLGQRHAGGIVFHVDGTGQHGLVVAEVEYTNTSWGCQGTSIATGTAVGTGAANTAAIVANCGTAGIAARLADDLVLNGYTDWFLPSSEELALARTTLGLEGLGGFGTNTFWTSSQSDPTGAFTISFYDGRRDSYGKGYPGLRTRAVRAF